MYIGFCYTHNDVYQTNLAIVTQLIYIIDNYHKVCLYKECNNYLATTSYDEDRTTAYCIPDCCNHCTKRQRVVEEQTAEHRFQEKPFIT